ncbi:MAG: hypothetical protein JJE55_12825 [Flavobacteriaceae bacterium]|nr:hypothetical protein [Flavobacteriaceae bacterium]
MYRQCVYAKDLAVITGKTPETCNKTLREIRKIKEKKKNSPITIYEAAEFLEMDPEIILDIVRKMDNVPKQNASSK